MHVKMACLHRGDAAAPMSCTVVICLSLPPCLHADWLNMFTWSKWRRIKSRTVSNVDLSETSQHSYSTALIHVYNKPVTDQCESIVHVTICSKLYGCRTCCLPSVHPGLRPISQHMLCWGGSKHSFHFELAAYKPPPATSHRSRYVAFFLVFDSSLM